ncbi:MAG: hypothetical protein FJX54_22200 [Alphaproteobacteria bacterium]|nr:hypothetical protein [Alphaproteobacteria bacterium]
MTGTDWYSEIMGEAPPAAPAAEVDWYKEIVGGRPQQEVRSAPFKGKPIGDSPDKAAPALAAARASLAPDEKDQIKRYAAQMFPDMPLEIAVRRFGVVDGNIVYADEEGNYNRVTPSVAGSTGVLDAAKRVGKWAAAQIGPSIPAAAGMTVGAATVPSGASIPLAAGAAGGADIVRQMVDRLLAGEDVTDVDLTNALGHALTEGAGQGVAVGGVKLFNRNPLKIEKYDRLQALDPAKRAEIEILEKEAKKRGIDLSAGQASGLRSLLARERWLARQPETQDKMYDFAVKQREAQVPQAIRDQIGRLSGREGEEAIQGFRKGAAEVVNRAKKEVSDKATAAYAAALDNRNPYWDDHLAALFKRPQMQEAWKKAQENARNRGIELPPIMDLDASGAVKFTDRPAPSWRAWDEIKRALDDIVEANKNQFGKPTGTAASALKIKTEMLEVLDKVNPEYAAARAAYGDAVDAANVVLKGGVGFLDKIGGLDRQAIVNRIFSGQNMTADEVRRMRGQFEKAGKLDDWNAGMASYLSDKLDDAMKMNASGGRGNVPGKFYGSLWGDARQKKIIEAALGNDPVQMGGMDKLMRVLNAASKSLPEGSPTATDLAAPGVTDAAMKGVKVVGKLASPSTYFNIGDEAVKGLQAMREPEARIKLAEALTSGAYSKQLAQLRLLSPTSEKAAAIVAQIMASAGMTATGARTPADMTPPIESDAATR